MKVLTKLAAATVLGLSMVAGAVSADVVEDRQKGFKSHVGNMKAVKAALDSGTVSDAMMPATQMVAFARTIPQRFPEGSGEGETRALPKIWSDWAGFEKAAADHVAATEKLLAAVAAGDADAVGTELKATGGTCGACHKPYRAEKN